MTEKVPPGRPPGRRQSPPLEADLDADLWSSPAEAVPAEEPPRVPPWLQVVPGPDAADGSAPGLAAYYQPGSESDPVPDAPGPERGLAALFREPAAPRGRGPTEPTSRGRIASRPPRMPARERLRAQRQRQDRRRRRIRMVAVGAGLVVLMGAGAVALLLHPHGPAASTRIVQVGSRFAGPYAPVTMKSAESGVTMGQPGVSRPVLDVYEDFQCPPCRAFERANGGVIQQLAALGKIKVIYHLFTIFSGQPQLANSTRAWAAARCVPASKWVAFHNALFAGQPALTTVGGFPVGQLVQLGRSVGITSQGFASCVQSQRYAAQDAAVSSRVIGNGPDGLPTLRLNGQLLTVNPISTALRQKLISATS